MRDEDEDDQGPTGLPGKTRKTFERNKVLMRIRQRLRIWVTAVGVLWGSSTESAERHGARSSTRGERVAVGGTRRSRDRCLRARDGTDRPARQRQPSWRRTPRTNRLP